MRNLLIFMLIFGGLVIATAVNIYISKDPAKSIPFFRKNFRTSKKEAVEIKRKVSRYLAIIGLVIVVLCLIGLIFAE